MFILRGYVHIEWESQVMRVCVIMEKTDLPHEIGCHHKGCDRCSHIRPHCHEHIPTQTL